MDFDELGIYDDLEEIQKQEDQKSKELRAFESKYNDALKTITALKANNDDLNKKIAQLQVNFQNLLETAKAEVRRKDKVIEQLRTEKDDVCFRRKIPQSSGPCMRVDEGANDAPPERPYKNPFRRNEVHSRDYQSDNRKNSWPLDRHKGGFALCREQTEEHFSAEARRRNVLRMNKYDSSNASSDNEQGKDRHHDKERAGTIARRVEKGSSRQPDLKVRTDLKCEERNKKYSEKYERKSDNLSKLINGIRNVGKAHLCKTNPAEIVTRKAIAETTQGEDIKKKHDVAAVGEMIDLLIKSSKTSSEENKHGMGNVESTDKGRERPNAETQKHLTEGEKLKESENLIHSLKKTSKEKVEKEDVKTKSDNESSKHSSMTVDAVVDAANKDAQTSVAFSSQNIIIIDENSQSSDDYIAETFAISSNDKLAGTANGHSKLSLEAALQIRETKSSFPVPFIKDSSNAAENISTKILSTEVNEVDSMNKVFEEGERANVTTVVALRPTVEALRNHKTGSDISAEVTKSKTSKVVEEDNFNVATAEVSREFRRQHVFENAETQSIPGLGDYEEVRERDLHQTSENVDKAGYTYRKTIDYFQTESEVIDLLDDTDLDTTDEESEQPYRMVINTEVIDNRQGKGLAEEGKVCKTEQKSIAGNLQEGEIREDLEVREKELGQSLKAIVISAKISNIRNDTVSKKEGDVYIKAQTLKEESIGKCTKMAPQNAVEKQAKDRKPKESVIELSDDENVVHENNLCRLDEKVINTEDTDNQEAKEPAKEETVCKDEPKNIAEKLQEGEIKENVETGEKELGKSFKDIAVSAEIGSIRNDIGFENDGDLYIKGQTIKKESNGKHTKMTLQNAVEELAERRESTEAAIDLSIDKSVVDGNYLCKLDEKEVKTDAKEKQKPLGEQSEITKALDMLDEVLKEKHDEKEALAVHTIQTENKKNEASNVSRKSAEKDVAKKTQELKDFEEYSFVSRESTTEEIRCSSAARETTHTTQPQTKHSKLKIEILEDISLPMIVELTKKAGQSQEESGIVTQQAKFDMCGLEHVAIETTIDIGADKEGEEHKTDLITAAKQVMTVNKELRLDTKQCEDEERIYNYGDNGGTKNQDDINTTEGKPKDAKFICITGQDKAFKKILDKTIDDKNFSGIKSNNIQERIIAPEQLREIENHSAESSKSRCKSTERELKSHSTTPSKMSFNIKTGKRLRRPRKRLLEEDELTIETKQTKKQKTKEQIVSIADQKEDDSQKTLKISIPNNVELKKDFSSEMDEKQRDTRASEKNDYKEMNKLKRMSSKLTENHEKRQANQIDGSDSKERKKNIGGAEKKPIKHINATDEITQNYSEKVGFMQSSSSTANKTKAKIPVTEIDSKGGKTFAETDSHTTHHKNSRTVNIELDSPKKLRNINSSKLEIGTSYKDKRVKGSKKPSQSSDSHSKNLRDQAKEKRIELTPTPHRLSSKKRVLRVLSSSDEDIEVNLDTQQKEEKNTHKFSDKSALQSNPQSPSKREMNGKLSAFPTKTEYTSTKECSPTPEIVSKRPIRCKSKIVSSLPPTFSDSRRTSNTVSPCSPYNIFQTDFEHSATSSTGLQLSSTSCSPDAKMLEIYANMNNMFQSPPNKCNAEPVLVDTPPPVSIDELAISTFVTPNASQNSAHETARDDNTNITFDETQPSFMSEQQSSQTSPNESERSLESKNFSMGNKEYRVEKISANEVNIFITRKRKRLRN